MIKKQTACPRPVLKNAETEVLVCIVQAQGDRLGGTGSVGQALSASYDNSFHLHNSPVR